MKTKILIGIALLTIGIIGYIFGRRTCCVEKRICVKKCNTEFRIAHDKYIACLPTIKNCERFTSLCEHIGDENSPSCYQRDRVCPIAEKCLTDYNEALLNFEECIDLCNCNFWGFIPEETAVNTNILK